MAITQGLFQDIPTFGLLLPWALNEKETKTKLLDEEKCNKRHSLQIF